MKKLRLKVADFMEHNEVLTKLKGEKWYCVENGIMELLEKLKYDLYKIQQREFHKQDVMNYFEEYDNLLFKPLSLLETKNEQCLRLLKDQNIELEKENEELKELLKGAIVPKFRVGQEVQCFYGEALFKATVYQIVIHQNYISYVIRGNFYPYTLKQIERVGYELFETEQEAYKKLREN